MALQPLFIRGWKQLSAYELCTAAKIWNFFDKSSTESSLLELSHGEKKYETLSICENNENLLVNCRAKKNYENS